MPICERGIQRVNVADQSIFRCHDDREDESVRENKLGVDQIDRGYIPFVLTPFDQAGQPRGHATLVAISGATFGLALGRGGECSAAADRCAGLSGMAGGLNFCLS